MFAMLRANQVLSFGKESQLRKDLLIDSDEIDVDLTNVIAGKKASKKAAREARA